MTEINSLDTVGLEQSWVDAAHAEINKHICYAVIKGSRLYQINEPGADVDLVLVFREPTGNLLGIRKPTHTITRRGPGELQAAG